MPEQKQVQVVNPPATEAAKQDMMMGMDPKKKLASTPLGDKAEIEADIPADQPYAIILKNGREELVTVDLALKAP